MAKRSLSPAEEHAYRFLLKRRDGGSLTASQAAALAQYESAAPPRKRQRAVEPPQPQPRPAPPPPARTKPAQQSGRLVSLSGIKRSRGAQDLPSKKEQRLAFEAKVEQRRAAAAPARPPRGVDAPAEAAAPPNDPSASGSADWLARFRDTAKVASSWEPLPPRRKKRP
jgi:hypothetical protein